MPETGTLTHADRVRLESLRYAVQPEAATYVAIMRTFTGGISGLLSDQSASEVAAHLAEMGLDLPVETVDERLSYLVAHGNLARSPRETEARSIREYLSTRARYQLTQRGELVHRQIEELLGATETAREVSSEMLGAILAGLTGFRRYDAFGLASAEPDEVAREITTLFAQFERLVESTRDFYTYLSQVLVRYDLDREEFLAFKSALLDYLQRFVDEIALHTPQIADAIVAVEALVPSVVGRANEGQRLVGIDGQQARRARGLDVADWGSLRSWFLGEGGRDSDAAQVRQLATNAMRALLLNLRRISASAEREVSRYRALLELARWFDESDDETAHALWAAAFGLYPCRHLGFVADSDAAPVPPTASWWRAPVADVPVTLRQSGDRAAGAGRGRRLTSPRPRPHGWLSGRLPSTDVSRRWSRSRGTPDPGRRCGSPTTRGPCCSSSTPGRLPAQAGRSALTGPRSWTATRAPGWSRGARRGAARSSSARRADWSCAT